MLAAAVLAGCGSSSSSSPLNTELSYFPADSPFLMSIATDPNSSAVKGGQALLHRFGAFTFGEAAVISRLQQLGINYDNDIRPLFGNPLVFGFSGTNLRARNAFVAVWITKDAGALNRLVKRLSSGLRRTGTFDGATLYRISAASLAISGATLVVGPTATEVQRALDRHAHGGGFSSSQYTHDVSGLPSGPLLQAFGNLNGVLSQPRAAKARRVPWVSALRGYAASINASSSGLTLQYKLDTSGAPLSASQLPIASGPATPSLAGSLPITAGLRNPTQLVAFAESAQQASNPKKYSQFVSRQARLRRATGVDDSSLLRLLTGDAILQSDTRTTTGRATVSDPAAASRTLAKLATRPDLAFGKGNRATPAGGGFFRVQSPGHRPVLVGVASNELVAGSRATVGQLRTFATAPAIAASGARGAVAFRVALPQLLHVLIRQAPPKALRTILGSLGDLTGWTASSTSAMTGSASIAVK
jgi:hypothetical protein